MALSLAQAPSPPILSTLADIRWSHVVLLWPKESIHDLTLLTPSKQLSKAGVGQITPL